MKSVHTAAISLVLASLACPSLPSLAAPGKQTSAVCKIALAVGMERNEVEEKVAAALGAEKHYSPYANDLKGGDVVYKGVGCSLLVTYAGGYPAYWLTNANEKENWKIIINLNHNSVRLPRKLNIIQLYFTSSLKCTL